MFQIQIRFQQLHISAGSWRSRFGMSVIAPNIYKDKTTSIVETYSCIATLYFSSSIIITRHFEINTCLNECMWQVLQLQTDICNLRAKPKNVQSLVKYTVHNATTVCKQSVPLYQYICFLLPGIIFIQF